MRQIYGLNEDVKKAIDVCLGANATHSCVWCDDEGLYDVRLANFVNVEINGNEELKLSSYRGSMTLGSNDYKEVRIY